MNRIARNLLLSAVAVAATSAFAQNQPIIGLITKTETNPFFVKMKEGAEAEAKKLGAKLLTAAGKQDGDTAAQIAALENMTTAGAKTILITSSGDAIIPTIKKVQAKGVQVIALDAPVGYMASFKNLCNKRPELDFDAYWAWHLAPYSQVPRTASSPAYSASVSVT